jgi:dihydrodipicolinate synthase/N-acetylneuraminate lyase
MQELNGLLKYDPGYVAPCKEALRLLGLPGGPGRGPLPELSPDERVRVRRALQALGKSVLEESAV